mmetsp:Transcript_24266/g.44618  ORF Transcript_24266/g.44618 Transcript_24266/m.44618 type:complete len:103 (+) Transcript_24266:1799-2107(+)
MMKAVLIDVMIVPGFHRLLESVLFAEDNDDREVDDKVPDGAPLEGQVMSLAAYPFPDGVLSPSECMFGCSDIMRMINIVQKCISASARTSCLGGKLEYYGRY